MQMPEQAKHIGDAAALTGGIVGIAHALTPVLTFILLVASTVWAILRIYEMWLSIKLKRKQLKDKQ